MGTVKDDATSLREVGDTDRIHGSIVGEGHEHGSRTSIHINNTASAEHGIVLKDDLGEAARTADFGIVCRGVFREAEN